MFLATFSHSLTFTFDIVTTLCYLAVVTVLQSDFVSRNCSVTLFQLKLCFT